MSLNNRLTTTICFNTQPPEGGWWEFKDVGNNIYMFQHAAARRRLVLDVGASNYVTMFQHAAARRRLETACVIPDDIYSVSTRSRPKAAGFAPDNTFSEYGVSTRSRPKAAGFTTADNVKRC